MTGPAVPLELAGERLLLLPDRAVAWPARRTLLIADLHLGKGEILRRHGIPVPRGGTGHDLARIDRLLGDTGSRRLLVLGDLVHGPGPAQAAWRQRLAAWRTARPDLELAVVGGNHDRHGALDGLGFTELGPVRSEPPFEFTHAPGDLPPGDGRVRLCGHLHPVLATRDDAGRLRVPVFWLRGATLVLPAFGGLTGGHAVATGPGERLWAALDHAVVALPGAAAAGAGRRAKKPSQEPDRKGKTR